MDTTVVPNYVTPIWRPAVAYVCTKITRSRHYVSSHFVLIFLGIHKCWMKWLRNHLLHEGKISLFSINLTFRLFIPRKTFNLKHLTNSKTYMKNYEIFCVIYPILWSWAWLFQLSTNNMMQSIFDPRWTADRLARRQNFTPCSINHTFRLFNPRKTFKHSKTSMKNS